MTLFVCARLEVIKEQLPRDGMFVEVLEKGLDTGKHGLRSMNPE